MSLVSHAVLPVAVPQSPRQEFLKRRPDIWFPGTDPHNRTFDQIVTALPGLLGVDFLLPVRESVALLLRVHPCIVHRIGGVRARQPCECAGGFNRAEPRTHGSGQPPQLYTRRLPAPTHSWPGHGRLPRFLVAIAFLVAFLERKKERPTPVARRTLRGPLQARATVAFLVPDGSSSCWPPAAACPPAGWAIANLDIIRRFDGLPQVRLGHLGSCLRAAWRTEEELHAGVRSGAYGSSVWISVSISFSA